MGRDRDLRSGGSRRENNGVCNAIAYPNHPAQVYVRAGIYHGVEPLCQILCTLTGANSDTAEWNEILEFDLPLKDIPRAAKLCFVILSATEAAMSKK